VGNRAPAIGGFNRNWGKEKDKTREPKRNRTEKREREIEKRAEDRGGNIFLTMEGQRDQKKN
jgi:hypothetical protein